MLLRYAILALLTDRDLHGYAIKAAFDKRVGPLWVLNFGQIYQSLKHLKGRGLLAARLDQGSGHIGRWVYTITPKGRRALATWLKRAPRRPQPVRDEMFIRLLVLDRLAEDAIDQLDRQERVYRAHLNALTATAPADANDILRVLVRDAQMFHVQAHLRWLSHCKTVLGTADSLFADDEPSTWSNEKKSATANG